MVASDARTLAELFGGTRRRVTNHFSKNSLLGMYPEFSISHRFLFAFVIFIASVISICGEVGKGNPASSNSPTQVINELEFLSFGGSTKNAIRVENRCITFSDNEINISDGPTHLSLIQKANISHKVTLNQGLASVSDRYLRFKRPLRSIIWQLEFLMLPHLKPAEHIC